MYMFIYIFSMAPEPGLAASWSVHCLLYYCPELRFILVLSHCVSFAIVVWLQRYRWLPKWLPEVPGCFGTCPERRIPWSAAYPVLHLLGAEILTVLVSFHTRTEKKRKKKERKN